VHYRVGISQNVFGRLAFLGVPQRKPDLRRKIRNAVAAQDAQAMTVGCEKLDQPPPN
jgi:hypothetical protein